MRKEISPALAAVIIVVVVALLGFAGYKLFLEPKAPTWKPPANYGASNYNQPMVGR